MIWKTELIEKDFKEGKISKEEAREKMGAYLKSISGNSSFEYTYLGNLYNLDIRESGYSSYEDWLLDGGFTKSLNRLKERFLSLQEKLPEYKLSLELMKKLAISKCPNLDCGFPRDIEYKRKSGDKGDHDYVKCFMNPKCTNYNVEFHMITECLNPSCQRLKKVSDAKNLKLN